MRIGKATEQAVLNIISKTPSVVDILMAYAEGKELPKGTNFLIEIHAVIPDDDGNKANKGLREES